MTSQLAVQHLINKGSSIYDVHKKINVYDPLCMHPRETDPIPLWMSTHRLYQIQVTLLKQL